MKDFKTAISNSKGQGLLEYLILTGLIGIFCLAMVRETGEQIHSRMEQVKEKVTSIKIK